MRLVIVPSDLFTISSYGNSEMARFTYTGVVDSCGAVARSPVKRESIPFEKWRELLIESGREVVPL